MAVNRAEYLRKYKEENKQKISEYNALESSRNLARERSRRYYQNHKEQEKARQRSMDRNEYYRNYYKNKRKANAQYGISSRCRSRITAALKSRGIRKNTKSYAMLGCTGEELARHIEALFLPGMSWENRDKWHIDHIKPVASFDLMDERQLYECFHYTNLQPLWAEDNLKKGCN